MWECVGVGVGMGVWVCVCMCECGLVPVCVCVAAMLQTTLQNVSEFQALSKLSRT